MSSRHGNGEILPYKLEIRKYCHFYSSLNFKLTRENFFGIIKPFNSTSILSNFSKATIHGKFIFDPLSYHKTEDFFVYFQVCKFIYFDTLCVQAAIYKVRDGTDAQARLNLRWSLQTKSNELSLIFQRVIYKHIIWPCPISF